MLDAGVAIVDEALMATESYEAADDGWTKIIDGDAEVREASALMKTMSKTTVRESMDKTNAAMASFYEAQSLLGKATDSYPGLDLSPFEKYLSKRLEAQSVALEADQAYLDRDKTALKKKNNSYNQLEEESAELAQKLEKNPEELVVEKYRAAVEDKKKAYDAERLKAANADTFLRDYLGTTPE